MSKATVTKLFFAAILALAVGLVMSLATVIAALVGGAVHVGGPNVVRVDGAAIVGTLPWLLMAAMTFAVGEIAALAAWIGALLTTWLLEDKTWFVALFVLGLFSLGWVAMAAYVFAGPDAWSPRAARRGNATTSGT